MCQHGEEFVLAPLADHLLRGLGADHQHATHAVGRVGLVDGAVAVGPVDLLQFAVPDDGYQGVFVPGGRIAAHHLVDLRANDRPDFRPGLLCGPSQDGGVLFRPERTPVCVVVEAGEIAAPEDEDGMSGG